MATGDNGNGQWRPTRVVNGGGGGFGSGGGGGGGEFNLAEAPGFLSGNGKKLVFFGLLLAAAFVYYQVDPTRSAS